MQPDAGRRSSLHEAANQIQLAIAHFCSRGFPGGLVVKNLPANAGGPGDTGSIPRSGKTPLEKEMATAPVFLPGKAHEQGSLAGYSPWGCKESDATKHIGIFVLTKP